MVQLHGQGARRGGGRVEIQQGIDHTFSISSRADLTILEKTYLLGLFLWGGVPCSRECEKGSLLRVANLWAGTCRSSAICISKIEVGVSISVWSPHLIKGKRQSTMYITMHKLEVWECYHLLEWQYTKTYKNWIGHGSQSWILFSQLLFALIWDYLKKLHLHIHKHFNSFSELSVTSLCSAA